MCVVGERLLPFLNNAAITQLFEQHKDKRLQIGLGAWFVGNLIKTQLSSTGALEVFFDGQLVQITTEACIFTLACLMLRVY